MNALIVNCSPVKTGATAEIVKKVSDTLSSVYETKCICIDDYNFNFCRGCRVCHRTAKCVQKDDIPVIIHEFEWADIIVSVSPSYWADIPGQFKAFIDRCTPWCNTHEPHAALNGGKKGFSIALRTGPDRNGVHVGERQQLAVHPLDAFGGIDPDGIARKNDIGRDFRCRHMELIYRLGSQGDSRQKQKDR